jgi:hypothetical protein
MSVGRENLLGKISFIDQGFPQLFSGLEVIAGDELLLCCIVSSGDHNLVSNDTRRCVSAAGNLGLPDDVFFFTPLRRRRLAINNPVSIRPAPIEPIFRFLLTSQVASGHDESN